MTCAGALHHENVSDQRAGYCSRYGVEEAMCAMKTLDITRQGDEVHLRRRQGTAVTMVSRYVQLRHDGPARSTSSRLQFRWRFSTRASACRRSPRRRARRSRARAAASVNDVAVPRVAARSIACGLGRRNRRGRADVASTCVRAELDDACGSRCREQVRKPLGP